MKVLLDIDDHFFLHSAWMRRLKTQSAWTVPSNWHRQRYHECMLLHVTVVLMQVLPDPINTMLARLTEHLHRSTPPGARSSPSTKV